MFPDELSDQTAGDTGGPRHSACPCETSLWKLVTEGSGWAALPWADHNARLLIDSLEWDRDWSEALFPLPLADGPTPGPDGRRGAAGPAAKNRMTPSPWAVVLRERGLS